MRFFARAIFLTFCLLALVMRPAIAGDAEPPADAFTLGGVTIGETSLQQAITAFGPAAVRKATREDESDSFVCYQSNKSGRKFFLKLESGVMGGSERRVTGILISTVEPVRSCSPTTIDLSVLKTGGGIHLGQTVASFLAAMPISFRRKDSTYAYDADGKRPATPNELAKLRATWPNEKQDYFDVVITIRAKFANGKLAHYYAHRIESY